MESSLRCPPCPALPELSLAFTLCPLPVACLVLSLCPFTVSPFPASPSWSSVFTFLPSGLVRWSHCPVLSPAHSTVGQTSSPCPTTSFLPFHARSPSSLCFTPSSVLSLAVGARTGEPNVCLIILLWLLDTAHLDPGAQMCGCHSDLSPSGKYGRPPTPERRTKQLCDFLLSRDRNVLPPPPS